MKKFLSGIVILLSICVLYSEEAQLDIFLTNYFSGTEYKVEKHAYEEFEFYFAHNVINKKDADFFNKGILFKADDDEIEPLAYFLENTVYSAKEKLFSGIIKTQTFYGWKVTFSDETNTFSTTFYTNKAKNVTDGPIFIWKDDSFTKFVVDRSVW